MESSTKKEERQKRTAGNFSCCSLPYHLFFTVTLHFTVFPALVFAVITAVPLFRAVTTPLAFTFATFLFELDHLILSMLSAGANLAINLSFSPLERVTFFLSSAIFFAGAFTLNT
jgi:hypothetical protein